MKTPLARIRQGAVILGVIIVVAVVGYRVFGGYDWVSSLWLVVVTISSVGYGEKSHLSPWLQLFTIAVIILGMSAAAYTIGGFIEMMTEGEIERALGRRRATRGIERLKNHVIICGFGRVGQVLAEAFQSRQQPYLVVDSDAERIEEARARGHLCLNGDATEEETLLQAGVQRAKAMVSTLPNDAANVFITLTSRELCPDVHIIARAEHESTKNKLRQAGADKVVTPTTVGAQQIVRMVTHPSTADLLELMSETTNLDVQLDEITIPHQSGLAGVTVGQSEAHRRHRLLVVAVKQAGGQMLFNPDADYTFQAGDVVILMGHEQDIGRFREQYRVGAGQPPTTR